jgi:archaellum component FlaC
MAVYNEKYGLVFDGQGNQNWGLTLHIPEKVPLTTNSIFDTYEHMMAYVNNPTSSAIQGLQLAVVNDSDATKNGIYYIKTIGTKGENGAALNNGETVKLSTAVDGTISADDVQSNLDELSDNFSIEVQERQAADTYISGVTSGLVSTLNSYKVKNVASADTFISLDANGVLQGNLSLAFDNTNKKIVLYGKSKDDNSKYEVTSLSTSDFLTGDMLSKAELKKEEGKPTKLALTFNTFAGEDTIYIDVEEFLNADEVEALENSLELHKGNTNLHFTTDEKTKLTNLYSKSELDNKFSNITSALTANTEAHANLSSEIASAKTDISTVSGQVSTISGQVSSISGEVSTISGQVSSVSGEVSTVKSNVSAISGEVKTISDKVSENEEVVSEALADLQANKVSSVVAEEGSNIVVNEVKNENGISYTIGFQWLTF